MSEEGNVGAVGSNLTEMLDDPGRPLIDRMIELSTAMMPMHTPAKGGPSRRPSALVAGRTA